MKLKDIPNIISVFRIALVIPVVLMILQGNYIFALIIFVIAGLSDGLDGFLAKHFKWQSRIGSILDPLADKLLLVSTYIAMAMVGVIPIWLVVAALARDVIIVVGAFAYHVMVGKYEMAPSFVSKFNTFMQILLIIGILSQQLTEIPPFAIDWLVYATMLTIIISGLDYIAVWGRKALYSLQKINNHD